MLKVPSRGLWGGSYHSRKLLALQFYLGTLWETSFITVTGTKMQYLATNVRRSLGFHLPSDDRTALGRVPQGLITLSSWHPCRVYVIFIHISKRNNPKRMCYIQSLCCPEPHNQCHFSYKIKGEALLETWIHCILGPIQRPKKGLM